MLAEVELIAQCDIVICNPSGFSEAIFLKGKECIVVDPPLHYVLKTIKNRFPLFNIGLGNISQIIELYRSIFQRHTKNYLTKKRFTNFSSTQMCARIRELNGDSTKKKIRGKVYHLWFIPRLKETDKSDLPIPDLQPKVPF